MSRLAFAALAVVTVAAVVVVRRGRCDTCGSYWCPVNLGGFERVR